MKTRAFKKALFGGFDKRDVMEYIAEMSAEAASARKEYLKNSEELKKQNEALKTSMDELSLKLGEQQKAAEELSVAKKELEEINASLTTDNSELRNELDNQVGKIFTQARITAQSIVHEARLRADGMNQKSDRLMSSAKEGVEDTRAAITAARDDIRVLLDETAEKLEEICDALLADVKRSEEPEPQGEPGVRKLPVKVSKRAPIARVK